MKPESYESLKSTAGIGENSILGKVLVDDSGVAEREGDMVMLGIA